MDTKGIRRKTGFIGFMTVVVAGAPSTGKSTLLRAMNAFDSEDLEPEDVNLPVSIKIPSPTKTDRSAMCSFYELTELRDFPLAQARMEHENQAMWKKCDVVVLVLSCTRRKSLEQALHLWDTHIKPLPNRTEIPVVLVITHTDAIPSGHVLSLLHHVMPIARAMPVIAVFTTPKPTCREDVEPLFTFLNRVARNPKRAFEESNQHEFPVYHLQPAPNAVGQFLMYQQVGQKELQANAESQGEDWNTIVLKLVDVVGVSALRELGWEVDEPVSSPRVPVVKQESFDLSPQDLEDVLSAIPPSPDALQWSATNLSYPAASALERWTSLFDTSVQASPSSNKDNSRPDSRRSSHTEQSEEA